MTNLNILFLYSNNKALSLANWLIEQENTVITYTQYIDDLNIFEINIDLIVSFTYRHIIPKNIIDNVNGNAINLHISYLPWNKGADPNIWSWLENTPKGVTIHYVSEKLDCGDIIAQKITDMTNEETLGTSYEKLMYDIQSLFKQIYPYYKYWNDMRKKNYYSGTYHCLADLEDFRSKIDYSIPVSQIINRYNQFRYE